MARTNIEEEAHRRVSKLAGLVGCSTREALGTVAYLWTDSQDILRTSGTRDEILEWSQLFVISDQDADRWIFALEKSRFISRLENGQYLIHGNETQIESRVKHTTRAAKGGNALKKKWNAKKKLKAGLKPTTSKPQAPDEPATSSPMQGNARQGNSEQGKARQGKELLEADRNSVVPIGPTSRDLIAVYCDLWKERYNSPRSPDIRGKTAGLFKNLIKDLGYERSETLVRAYLQMNDPWFLTKSHDVETLNGNLAKVALFADSGQMITRKEAQQADTSMALTNQLQRIREGKL